MGKNKLKKFSEMQTMDFVHQYPFARLASEEFPFRGKWHSDVFGNSGPIILELGCGKGEYTVNLARTNPEKNFIGIDIKGARMYTGAAMARNEKLSNVSFIRTSIELLNRFFIPGEVAEIWITFPDPQMNKSRKRLTSTRFLELYRSILKPDGTIHLKTDSPFLFTYTRILAEHNALPVSCISDNVHNGPLANDPTLSILTHYEQQWMQRGLSIKYIAFTIPESATLSEPNVEIRHDTYRSYSRGIVQCPEECSPVVLRKAGIIKI